MSSPMTLIALNDGFDDWYDQWLQDQEYEDGFPSSPGEPSEDILRTPPLTTLTPLGATRSIEMVDALLSPTLTMRREHTPYAPNPAARHLFWVEEGEEKVSSHPLSSTDQGALLPRESIGLTQAQIIAIELAEAWNQIEAVDTALIDPKAQNGVAQHNGLLVEIDETATNVKEERYPHSPSPSTTISAAAQLDAPILKVSSPKVPPALGPIRSRSRSSAGSVKRTNTKTRVALAKKKSSASLPKPGKPSEMRVLASHSGERATRGRYNYTSSPEPQTPHRSPARMDDSDESEFVPSPEPAGEMQRGHRGSPPPRPSRRRDSARRTDQNRVSQKTYRDKKKFLAATDRKYLLKLLAADSRLSPTDMGNRLKVLKSHWLRAVEGISVKEADMLRAQLR